MPLPAGLKARLKRFRLFLALNKFRHKACRVMCNLVAKLPVSSLTLGPPKGYHVSTRKFIEGWKSDPANPAVFRGLVASEEITVPAPKVVIGTKKDYLLNPHSYRSEEAFLATLPWGRFYHSPQAFIAPDDRLLADMSPVWGEHPADHWIFDKMKLARPHTLRGKTLYLGSSSWFFHFLFEHLSTLDLVERAGMRLAEFDHVILENHGQPFAEEALDHLRIPREKVIDPRQHPHLLCESLTAPSFPYPWSYGRWRAEFLKRSFENYAAPSSVASKRIFISRKTAKGRRLVNEEELVPVLHRHGFAVLEMDKLPFAEQIGVFQQAEIVVGPAGAAFTLLCFCRPGTRVLSILCDEDTSGGALARMWETVSELKGLEFYLCCVQSPNTHVSAATPYFSADLVADVKLFEQLLEKVIA